LVGERRVCEGHHQIEVAIHAAAVSAENCDVVLVRVAGFSSQKSIDACVLSMVAVATMIATIMLATVISFPFELTLTHPNPVSVC